MTTKFDIKRDGEKILKGKHFFCRGHLSGVPIKRQSKNKKYCSECYKVIRGNL